MIKVVTPGLYTTLQDLGRFGYRNMGVPLSGAMDQHAAKSANQLVQNPENTTVLEFTLMAPTLFFEKNATIAITGATFSAKVNNTEIPLNEILEITAGSTLTFNKPIHGLRGYLAIKGGFKTESVLGSTSFYTGITQKARLEKGDTLHFTTENNTVEINFSEKISPISFSEDKIEVFKGPEFEALSEAVKMQLLQNEYTVSSESNRMAMLLNGIGELSANEIITAPVQPGTVQLTPSGKLIILMRDSQTTGGYARVLQLTENAINRLAQKRPQQSIQFELLTD